MFNSRYDRKRRQKLRLRRTFFLFLAFVIISGSSYFAYDLYTHAKHASDNIYQEIDKSKISNFRDEDIEVTKEPFTILLVGADGQEDGARSDVLMLASVNPLTEEVYLLSIPRDTRTYIPELGYETKINHSYGAGGIESTIGAINNLIDIPIDYYISTNFDGFEDVIDTFGGIEVEVPFDFEAQLTGSLKWKKYYAGKMELNGNEALAYVRMRKADPLGDFGRNTRQQQVIKALIDKGTSITSITKVDNLLDNLGDNVKTNIPPRKLASFIKLYTQIKNTTVQNLKLEGSDKYINDVYYYIPADDSIAEINTILKSNL